MNALSSCLLLPVAGMCARDCGGRSWLLRTCEGADAYDTAGCGGKSPQFHAALLSADGKAKMAPSPALLLILHPVDLTK